MRRIALISEHASPLALIGGTDAGGQNVYVAHLATQLARRGYHVDVFTRRDKALARTVVNWKEGVRVVHINAGPARFLAKEDLLPYMGEFAQNIVEFFRRQSVSYALVHANFFMSGMAAQHVKRVLKIPFVITFHALGRVRRMFQGDADRFPSSRFQIEHDLVRDADRIIAECPQDLQDLTALYAADAKKIVVIPCGFDPAELSPAAPAMRTELGIEPDEFVVLQLGRLVPRKGIDNVIEAVSVLKREHGIRARLVIVGGNSEQPSSAATPEIGRLTDIARNAGILDQVVFAGRRSRDALRGLYCAADVFVTTPWYEPFGITPVEAMACGIPVIGSAVGGIKYSVVDGKTGFLVPPKDPQRLAERLAVLYRQPELAHAMGREGQRRARQLFTWRRVAGQVAELYESMLPRRSAEAADVLQAGATG
ncbi:MAG TPA: glycosyltransferase family 1 protein [Burkholderiales bacterium]|nr:glycosyltransferase family 1 protein [Burkholderiales bacterium]